MFAVLLVDDPVMVPPVAVHDTVLPGVVFTLYADDVYEQMTDAPVITGIGLGFITTLAHYY